MAIALNTEDKLEYQFYPLKTEQLQFRVKAPNDAHIVLTNAPHESEPMYEIFIGGWGNSKSVVRKNRAKPEVAEAVTPGVLDPNELRGFWIRWGNGEITVGKEGEQTPFLVAQDYEISAFNHFGICTGWGASGEWHIEAICVDGYDSGPKPSAPSNLIQGNVTWCDVSGPNVPPGAVEGGSDADGDLLYVGRAQHGGALIPGKVKASHGVCYVPWGGEEHGKSDYQVLCGIAAQWVAVSGGNLPPNALPSGETEEGEPLFVGRVNHEGTVTPGKVQASHGCCYIPFAGQEMSFPDYEVLVGQ